MPNTTKGYRYPASTDPVAQGATAIQNLATDVDTKAGVLAANTIAFAGVGTTQMDVAVTFPTGRFTANPTIVLSVDMGGLAVGQQFVAFPAVVSATGFTFRVRAVGSSSLSGGNFTGYWIARTTG